MDHGSTPIRASEDPSCLYQPEPAEGTKYNGPKRIHIEKIDQSRALRALLGGRSVVYAVRFPDGIVKIGTSEDLAARHRHFRAAGGEIVGFRFGDYADEQAIHATSESIALVGASTTTPQPKSSPSSTRDDFGMHPSRTRQLAPRGGPQVTLRRTMRAELGVFFAPSSASPGHWERPCSPTRA
jgi:hypothetical protein